MLLRMFNGWVKMGSFSEDYVFGVELYILYLDLVDIGVIISIVAIVAIVGIVAIAAIVAIDLLTAIGHTLFLSHLAVIFRVPPALSDLALPLIFLPPFPQFPDTRIV